MTALLLLVLQAGPGVVEHLGDRVPLELELLDAHGEAHRLGELFDGRTPVVVTPVYYGCPALCGLVPHRTQSALRETVLKDGRDKREIE
jgi:protein SCO1/2